jgi:hypothetical protein
MTIDHSGTLLWSEMLAPAVADLKVACRRDSVDLAESRSSEPCGFDGLFCTVGMTRNVLAGESGQHGPSASI